MCPLDLLLPKGLYSVQDDFDTSALVRLIEPPDTEHR